MQPNNPMKRQQDLMRQQQEQMRKQQEAWRQQQMAAAWMEQQKAKQAAQQPVQQPATEFDRVAAAVQYLRQEFTAGRITRQQAEAQLKSCVVKDANGNNWTLGFETGTWYRLVNGQWVKASQAPLPAQPAMPAVMPTAQPVPKTRWWAGCLVFVFSIIIFFGVGYGIGKIVEEIGWELGIPDAGLIPAGLIWLVGLVVSILWARKAARPR